MVDLLYSTYRIEKGIHVPGFPFVFPCTSMLCAFFRGVTMKMLYTWTDSYLKPGSCRASFIPHEEIIVCQRYDAPYNDHVIMARDMDLLFPQTSCATLCLLAHRNWWYISICKRCWSHASMRRSISMCPCTDFSF